MSKTIKQICAFTRRDLTAKNNWQVYVSVVGNMMMKDMRDKRIWEWSLLYSVNIENYYYGQNLNNTTYDNNTPAIQTALLAASKQYRDKHKPLNG